MRRRFGILALAAWGGCATVPVTPVVPRSVGNEARVREADALRRRGAWADAAALYDEAIGEDPKNVRAHVGRQEIAREHASVLDLRRRYRAGPEGYLQARLEGNAARRRDALVRSAEPWRTLGEAEAHADEDAHEAALAAFGTALARDPGLVEAWLGRGRLFARAGRLGRAESDFRTARWLAPEHPVPYLGLSVVADRRGDLLAAFRWALEAYRRAPGAVVVAERVRALAGRTGRTAWIADAGRLLAESDGAADGAVRLAAGQLLAAAGRGDEAEAAWAEARARGAGDAEIAATREAAYPPALAPFLEPFVRGVRARYRHYAATSEAESFDDFVDWARDLFERTMGRALGPRGTVRRYAFIGTLVDPSADSDEPLVRALAEHGLLLVLGRRSGGPPEALVAEVERRDPPRAITVRGSTLERAAVFIGARHLSGYQEWAGGGDLAGLALDRLVIVDLHAAARWEAQIDRGRRRREGARAAILGAAALADTPVTAIDDPAGVAERLFLAGRLDVAGEVLVHEDAHLVDAARHLPVGRHPIRNLSLAVRHGFRASRILATLERNAQLTAIAEGPTPRASLAVCCERIDGEGPHAQGYTAIVRGFVRELHRRPRDFPAIDPDRVLVQQLHRLTDDEVRAIAVALMRRWGIGAG